MPDIFDRVLPLNLIANTVIFYVAARLYLLPLVSRLRPQQILVPILLLHSTRHLGMMFLTRGATYPGLPPEFAYPAAFTLGTIGRDTFTGPVNNWMQLGLSKTWAIRERFRFMLRVEGNNFPFKHPQLTTPNTTYNANSANLFGTFTSLRNPFAEPGQSRPHVLLGGRIQF